MLDCLSYSSPLPIFSVLNYGLKHSYVLIQSFKLKENEAEGK